jgi:hypothetical protein
MRQDQRDTVAAFSIISGKHFRTKCLIYDIIGKDMVGLITQHAWQLSQISQEDSDIFMACARIHEEEKKSNEATSKRQRILV